jgi:N-methylhydantoinase A/oxoprolinase/acetone carboxylase beta subunit
MVSLHPCEIGTCNPFLTIQVDIGGTTSDFAALSASGYPKQSAATVNIAGVRTAFSMPEVYSIGLGGGSIVTPSHQDASDEFRVLVGPASVGCKLTTESKCFGGSTLTATDIVVASGLSKSIAPSLTVEVNPKTIQLARENIRRQLQRGVDMMRTSDMDVVLLLVGGGSIIQMDELDGVKICIRPDYYDVANAVGAALANVDGYTLSLHYETY